MGAQAPVEQVEILGESLRGFIGVGVEAPPHERELPAVRLVEGFVARFGCVLRHLLLVPGDRRAQLRLDVDEVRRYPDRGGERTYLVAVAEPEQRPRPLQRLPDGVRAGVRIAVGVAADPRAEP